MANKKKQTLYIENMLTIQNHIIQLNIFVSITLACIMIIVFIKIFFIEKQSKLNHGIILIHILCTLASLIIMLLLINNRDDTIITTRIIQHIKQNYFVLQGTNALLINMLIILMTFIFLIFSFASLFNEENTSLLILFLFTPIVIIGMNSIIETITVVTAAKTVSKNTLKKT